MRHQSEPKVPLSASTRVTITIHTACIAIAPSRDHGSTSWARMRARARRCNRETCIWEKPTLAAMVS